MTDSRKTTSILTGMVSAILLVVPAGYSRLSAAETVFLNANETRQIASVSRVYGARGFETIALQNSGSATLDGNIERVELPKALASYQVSISGTTVTILDGSSEVVTFKGINQPVTIAFSDGSTTLQLTALNSATLGGMAFSNGPTAISTVLNGDDTAVGTPSDTTAPDFAIQTNTDSGFSQFDRKITVFDLPVYAAPSVNATKLTHAANVLAQYLDNDENGTVDNPVIWEKMKQANAFLFLWQTESERDNFEPPPNASGQDLGADETQPEWHNNHTGQFDAALEEVWHLITHNGYSSVYPSVFGEQVGSSMAQAMDIARGGQFITPPGSYPAGAWYTYDDETCDYSCMATEYFYWGMTSLLGAQANRFEDISQEWQPNTAAKLQSTDTLLYQLLTDTTYMFPTVLPDGSYGTN